MGQDRGEVSVGGAGLPERPVDNGSAVQPASSTASVILARTRAVLVGQVLQPGSETLLGTGGPFGVADGTCRGG